MSFVSSGLLAKDESSGGGRGRNLDRKPDGTPRNASQVVLYRSDFSQGYDGWTDHWSGGPFAQPQPPIARTSEISYRGSHCLMLSTGEHASPPAGDISSSASAFKRVARHDEYRYHHFSAFLALGIGGFSQSWVNFAMMIDTNAWDNSQRSFYTAQCASGGSPNLAHWRILDSSAVAHTATGLSSNGFVGDNENKMSFVYVRLTIDLNANSGTGGYQELQVGRTTVDLTGAGGGNASSAVQYDGSTSITNFGGGFNIGFSISRDSTLQYGCQLFVDDIVYSASNSL